MKLNPIDAIAKVQWLRVRYHRVFNTVDYSIRYANRTP